ncbi:MAG: triose-phosphate isomerase [Anaerolineaceae bacterium]|nr:triose-phosphate isomerase [Anaerolineaceae bacterium]
MFNGFTLNPPFFEIGPKAYLYGDQILALAKCADEASVKYGVEIIFTPQLVDIRLIVRETKNLLVFAQHMDSLGIGRGIGSVLPEAVKAAGAVGVLLNHVEKPLTPPELIKTIHRADEVGLASMVCAGNLEEVKRVATLHPNIVLAEAPELIGVGKRSENDQKAVQKINEIVSKIDPAIHVLHGAGISCGRDVYEVIKLGAEATGSTSGIIQAKEPCAMIEEMISSVRKAWNAVHHS